MPQPIRAVDVEQLATATRNGFVENRFFGSAVVVDPDGVITASVGDPAAGVYPRSALKPFQAIASLRCGAQLSGASLALASGSHMGSAWHQDIAADILAQAGVGPDDLACPAALPSSSSEVAQAALQMAPLPLERSPLAHNCSGKHAGFLAATVASGSARPNIWTTTPPHRPKRFACWSNTAPPRLPTWESTVAGRPPR